MNLQIQKGCISTQKNVFMKQQRWHLEKKRLRKEGKQFFGDAELEKEIQNKKQLFLNWLSTKNVNDKVQYKREQEKIKIIVTNHRNEFWDKKCMEIQSYLGCKEFGVLEIYEKCTFIKQ
jgi:prophage antirepressor-like protein